MKFKKMYIILSVIGLLVVAVVVFMNLPRFGALPSGDRLRRIERSPNYRLGSFRNLEPTPQITSEKGRASAMCDFLFKKRERNRPEREIPTVKNDLRNLPLDQDLVVWFGHSSYFLQIDGKRILVDPVFYDASPVSFFNRSFQGADIYKAEDMPDIDYLVITHDHWDHLDYQTVTRLKDRVGRVICPLGVGAHFERWGYGVDRLVELDWYEQAQMEGNYNFHCLPTRHFSGRGLKPNQTLWGSFMVTTASQTIYIGGDGGYGNHFTQIARLYPSIDLALIENGQYNEDWRFIHLMPEDLVKAIKDLDAKQVIAGHNSKYALARHPWDEPLGNAQAIESVIMPMVGQVVDLPNTLELAGGWWHDGGEKRARLDYK